MKKQIAILVIIIVVCSAFLFFIIQISKKPAENIPSDDSSGLSVLGNRPSSTQPTGETFTIPTKQGDVVVKNFLKTGEPLQGEPGVFIERTPDYTILFYTTQRELLITLESKPVIAAKQKAEEALVRLLGASKEDICKLNFSVGTTVYIDPDLAGKELGLSFCK